MSTATINSAHHYSSSIGGTHMNTSTISSDMISPPSHNSNRSTGITHQIRNKLNFNDEKIWKRFSSRRLELIDTMNLSTRKASEQDDEILQCSQILMKEFNYDDRKYLADFIKLVRVAIQSVRRNRKRSTKSSSSSKAKPTKFIMVKQVSTPNSDFDRDDEDDEEGFKITDVLQTDTDHPHGSTHHSNGMAGSASAGTSPSFYQHPQYISNGHTHSHHSHGHHSQLPINSLLQPVLPRSASRSTSFTKLPSFSSLLVDDKFGHRSNSASPVNGTSSLQSASKPQQELSVKEVLALNKLLSLIKKSKTCSDLSSDSQASSFYENLEMLGSTVILSTISYIFERFFVNLNPSSISYLRLKLNNDFTLSKILKNLDISLNENYYNDFISLQTFKRLIGCCVKDFGFDQVITPLTDVIHELILKGYPLISKNLSDTGSTKTGQNGMVQPASSADNAESHNVEVATGNANGKTSANGNVGAPATTPTKASSSEAPNPNLLYVELKFNNNFLNFKFDPSSHSKPTFIELLENSKDAFQLTSKNVFLKDLKNSNLIRNDEDVTKTFNHCKDGVVQIGVFVSNSQLSSNGAHSSSSTNLPKVSSPLDTLSNAAEVVESRSKEGSIGSMTTLESLNPRKQSSSPAPLFNIPMNGAPTHAAPAPTAIKFQPLL